MGCPSGPYFTRLVCPITPCATDDSATRLILKFRRPAPARNPPYTRIASAGEHPQPRVQRSCTPGVGSMAQRQHRWDPGSGG
eukprot:scaffold2556_cov425-Prasinococcus_capsulatus_cf.AAC.12